MSEILQEKTGGAFIQKKPRGMNAKVQRIAVQHFFSLGGRALLEERLNKYAFLSERFLLRRLFYPFIGNMHTFPYAILSDRLKVLLKFYARAYPHQEERIRLRRVAAKRALFREFLLHTKKRIALLNVVSGEYYLSYNKLMSSLVYSGFQNVLASIIRHDAQRYLRVPVSVDFVFLTNHTITPQVMLKYLLRKLEYLYLPGELIPRILQKYNLPISLDPLGNSTPQQLLSDNRPRVFSRALEGILFNCKGRFTRAQMASHYRFQAGRMPLTAISKNILYQFGTVSLKYGSLGVKVYLNYGKSAVNLLPVRGVPILSA